MLKQWLFLCRLAFLNLTQYGKRRTRRTNPDSYMPKPLFALLLVVASLAPAGVSIVSVAGESHVLVARRGSETGISLNEAVQQVQRETGGRVLSADTVNQGGRAMHRIKVLLPSGQVRVVTVGAPSGSH